MNATLPAIGWPTQNAVQRMAERHAITLDAALCAEIVAAIERSRALIRESPRCFQACVLNGAVRTKPTDDPVEQWAVKISDHWIELIMDNLTIVTVLAPRRPSTQRKVFRAPRLRHLECCE